MKRRTFLIGAAGVAIAGATLLTMDRWLIDKLTMRVKGLISPPPKMPPEKEREIVQLPAQGQGVSVELALNSRCTSDSDGNQRYVHWGMFEQGKTISPEQLNQVVMSSTVPRFTTERTTISSEGRRLTFSIDSRVSGMVKEWLMVENGMQQQAVCLVCAALGVGMVFRNLGVDGQVRSPSDWGTIRMDLDAMKPSYDGSFWTGSAPAERKPWLTGNLPDPHRDGNRPLLQVLKGLEHSHEGSKKADLPELGQLLWAAKGRTPHLYKSKPWALTVPFWTDRVETTSVYLIWNQRVFRYVNWDSNRPTHSIAEIRTLSEKESEGMATEFSGRDRFIVLGRNDDHGRAFWEIGYEVMNILAQAKSAELEYSSHLLNDTQSRQVTQLGIRNPLALVTF